MGDVKATESNKKEFGVLGVDAEGGTARRAAPSVNSAELQGFFPGDSEMAQRMREFDWSSTTLGPVETWPEVLTTTIRICLGSRHPIVIWWGKSALTQFYNDAYISFMGPTKHPSFLGRSGRECWNEIWPIIEAMLEGVFATGQATWSEDFLYVINRNLPQEEGYFNFSYSPIWAQDGQVAGIFCACYETTERVIGDRRLRLLRDLGRTVVSAKTAEAACEQTTETLANNSADIPFALIYLLDRDRPQARLAGSIGVDAGTEAAPQQIDLSNDARVATWPLARVFETGITEVVPDLSMRFGPLTGGQWPEAPKSALVLPIAASGQSRPTGFLVAGLSPRRVLDADYRSFLDLVAGHLATAVSNARAYEEERKRAEALAELDRAKTAFFANVSHEFRTPLTLMLGPLEDELRENATSHGRVEVIYRNALRLLKLVNTLLDFSRIEAGRITASYEPTDLGRYTAELASVFQSAIDKAGLRLVVDCPSCSEPVYVDREMWEKVVLNLLSNAFKFTFEGEIAVSLRASNNGVALLVRDTGIGIAPEELPRLFERFHRIEGVKARTYEGSGIGLALVQELVRLHGGNITVSSEPGVGTTFSVDLPFGANHLPQDCILSRPTIASVSTRAAAFVNESLQWLPGEESGLALTAQDQQAGSSERILVVDDNSDLRSYVARLLAERWTVETVENGVSALAAIRRQQPTLVITDVMMPGMDGFGLLRELRSDPATRSIPVIMLSARAGEESRVDGLDAGADDYVVKPFAARELLARVAMRLRLHATEKALRASQEEQGRSNAELDARLGELHKINQELRDSRRAALNLMQDLRKEVDEHKRTQESLRTLAESLDSEVRARTRELEERNAAVLEQTKKVQALSRSLTRVQDEERRHIARELHDSAGQVLAALGMGLAKIARVANKNAPEIVLDAKEAQEMVRGLTQEIRTTSYLLHPPLLDESGIAVALRMYIEGLSERSGLKIDLSIPEDLRRLPDDIELAVFRLVQESLTNIHRHSGSKTASIRIALENGTLSVTVADQGKGIPAEKLGDFRGGGSGIGIRGMKDRVEQVSGNLSIESSGFGTTINATVPIPEDRSSAQDKYPVRTLEATG